eukprot:TRINITY_DN221_c0_g1_i6.p3 TRINITY_DN221_c0_g1~~TRINITY_DN221_c0_g1_i6.p3  ORF type:complete len:110 (+),score=19.94 TRINITY_DN221_c0_g1_i6:77-406(+)
MCIRDRYQRRVHGILFQDMEDKGKKMLDAVDRLFDEIDKDKNGYLCATEVTEFLNLVCDSTDSDPLPIAEVQKGMEQLDKNKDGKLSKAEARPFLMEILKGAGLLLSQQ